MNQYPVVFLTLKDIDGLTFEDAYERLAVQISNLYKEHICWKVNVWIRMTGRFLKS